MTFFIDGRLISIERFEDETDASFQERASFILWFRNDPEKYRLAQVLSFHHVKKMFQGVTYGPEIETPLQMLRTEAASALQEDKGDAELSISDIEEVPAKDVTSLDFGIKDEKFRMQYQQLFNSVRTRPPISATRNFSDIDGRLEYRNEAIFTRYKHFGQRKLLLDEIRFLTQEVAPNERAVVIYAGAAPSNKGALLASLFLNVRFVLIDSAPFNIKPYKEIKISSVTTGSRSARELVLDIVNKLKDSHICVMNSLMTMELAEEFRKVFDSNENKPFPLQQTGWTDPTTCPLFLISDIRTALGTNDSKPTSFDIVWNSAQQMNWVLRMKPRASMLKFRTPFYNESDAELNKFATVDSNLIATKLDFDSVASKVNLREAFTQRKFWFLSGEIWIQPWTPPESAETRIVVKPGLSGYEIVEFHLKDYENAMFFYNKILRTYQLYENPLKNEIIGLDQCADCALEVSIWISYYEKYDLKGGLNLSQAVHHSVVEVSVLTGRSLSDSNHGKFDQTFTDESLSREIKQFQRTLKR